MRTDKEKVKIIRVEILGENLGTIDVWGRGFPHSSGRIGIKDGRKERIHPLTFMSYRTILICGK